MKDRQGERECFWRERVLEDGVVDADCRSVELELSDCRGRESATDDDEDTSVGVTLRVERRGERWSMTSLERFRRPAVIGMRVK